MATENDDLSSAKRTRRRGRRRLAAATAGAGVASAAAAAAIAAALPGSAQHSTAAASGTVSSAASTPAADLVVVLVLVYLVFLVFLVVGVVDVREGSGYLRGVMMAEETDQGGWLTAVLRPAGVLDETAANRLCAALSLLRALAARSNVVIVNLTARHGAESPRARQAAARRPRARSMRPDAACS